MAITSEIIGKLGGGEVEIIPVGQFTDTDLVIHSFTLDKPSVVSAALAGFVESVGTDKRWAAPTPSIEIRTPNGGEWGVTRFGTALESGSGSPVPIEQQSQNARFLSISAVLPTGDYEIVVNSRNSSRTIPVENATIVTTPL